MYLNSYINMVYDLIFIQEISLRPIDCIKIYIINVVFNAYVSFIDKDNYPYYIMYKNICIYKYAEGFSIWSLARHRKL